MKEKADFGQFEKVSELLENVKTVQVPILNSARRASRLNNYLQKHGREMSFGNLKFIILGLQSLNGDIHRTEEDMTFRKLMHLSTVNPPVELLEDRLAGLQIAKSEALEDPELLEIVEKSIDITLSDIRRIK